MHRSEKTDSLKQGIRLDFDVGGQQGMDLFSEDVLSIIEQVFWPEAT